MSPVGLAERLRDQSDVDCDATLLTPLFEAYIRMGAKACGGPALDFYMGSADFLMALPLSELAERFNRRYLKMAPA